MSRKVYFCSRGLRNRVDGRATETVLKRVTWTNVGTPRVREHLSLALYIGFFEISWNLYTFTLHTHVIYTYKHYAHIHTTHTHDDQTDSRAWEHAIMHNWSTKRHKRNVIYKFFKLLRSRFSNFNIKIIAK